MQFHNFLRTLCLIIRRAQVDTYYVIKDPWGRPNVEEAFRIHILYSSSAYFFSSPKLPYIDIRLTANGTVSIYNQDNAYYLDLASDRSRFFHGRILSTTTPKAKDSSIDRLRFMYSPHVNAFELHPPLKLQTFRISREPCSNHSRSKG